METTNQTFNLTCKHSKHPLSASLESLSQAAVNFLDHYGNSQLVDREFAGLTGPGDGNTQFFTLLKATGFENDPQRFFQSILSMIADSAGQTIILNHVTIPHLFLTAILEKVLPGTGYLSIKNTTQLEKATNFQILDEERPLLQKVIETYPVRLSMHTIRQMMVSRDVAYQYMPFTEELDSVGFTNTWIGQFHDGLLEQMYQNRVIFLLNMSCPVYCRFCFRKHKDSRNEKNPSVEDVIKAVDHVRQSPSVKEIVITGGDPFMDQKNMAAAINGLMDIDHVKTLRLATRSIAYYPELFLGRDSAYLKYLKQKNLELQQVGKRMEVATHFIHPDEISPESLEIISDMVKNGIAVYVQTPFLNNCNDKGPELVRLFGLLRGAGAELHYIYIPCSPIHGNSIYWSPLSRGIRMARYLRAHLSDRVMPRICTATPIGKMDWLTSGWAVEPVKENDRFLWLRTPYTPDYFKSFAPLSKDLDTMRVNSEGTIDIHYMATLGEEDLFFGQRPPRSANVNQPADPADIDGLRQQLFGISQSLPSILNNWPE